MADLELHGRVATVRLDHNPLDGDLTARCLLHPSAVGAKPGCDWTETYDDLNDAVEYAADHADGVR